MGLNPDSLRISFKGGVIMPASNKCYLGDIKEGTLQEKVFLKRNRKTKVQSGFIIYIAKMI